MRLRCERLPFGDGGRAGLCAAAIECAGFCAAFFEVLTGHLEVAFHRRRFGAAGGPSNDRPGDHQDTQPPARVEL